MRGSAGFAFASSIPQGVKVVRNLAWKTSGASLPLGLLGMITLVLAIEWYEARHAVMFARNGGESWRFASQKLKHRSQGREILCFGCSMMNFGVVPAVLQEQTGRRAYNLSLHSGSAPSSYFLLRRAVEAGSRPSALVVDFQYGILEDGPASQTRPYPWAELLSLREAIELTWTARDARLLAEILVNRTLPSENRRFAIREKILLALKGEPDPQYFRDIGIWRNWNRNDGALLKPKNPDFVDVPATPRSGKPSPGNWHCDPTNAVYVRKFLELAGRINARVYWLLPPVSPGVQCFADSQGNEAQYLGFVRVLQARYPHVVVIDGRHAGFKSDVFLDGVHLDCEGAVGLSTGIGTVLRSTWDQTSLTARWIALPNYARPSSHARMEDLSESFAVCERILRRRR
jgi:hypothetical protein